MDTMNVEDRIYLQQNIRCLRKSLNLSQEELAQRIGLNRGNIASYEKGTAEPKICNLLKLAKLFKVSIIDLTQKDLSNINLAEYKSSVKNFDNTELELIEKFDLQAAQLQELFKSLHTCCMYKANSIEEMPKDVQVMLTHFDQLYEASQALLGQYRDLIQFIKCRI